MSQSIPPKLRWACRRGMLELDIFLSQFLEEKYLTLTPEDQQIFVQLLSESDQDLFVWLSGREMPTEKHYVKLITAIRDHAIHRH